MGIVISIEYVLFCYNYCTDFVRLNFKSGFKFKLKNGIYMAPVCTTSSSAVQAFDVHDWKAYVHTWAVKVG